MAGAAGVDTVRCQVCNLPALPEFPHNHSTPIRTDYDPMGPRPSTLGHLIAVIRREYRNELPARLHSRSVPATPVETPLTTDASGPSAPLLDTGALGSPSWAPEFHRRVGAITYWEGEQTVDAGDWRIFPWAFVIETRLDRWCRSKHGNRPDLWREHRGEPICQPMVRMVIVWESPVQDAAERYEMTPERAALVLDSALCRVWGQVSNLLNRLPAAA